MEGYNVMTEQAKAAQRAYKKAWREKNRDKVKQAQERYWEKRAAQQAQKCEHTGKTNCRGCEYSRDPALFDGGCQYQQTGEQV